ncbi:MAG: transketolase [Bdellovibrionaceae bacterium]|nr:transketolase [Pseudobdellovibrionaceae bacterium]
MTEPMKLANKLAGNPHQQPLFKTFITAYNGTKIPAADPRATRALISLMDMNAVLGGAASHYGGPAAMAELMSALHALVFLEAKEQSKQWHELFNLVNDAGHCENGLYALKANYGMAGLNLNSLKKFRSIESPLTGHGEVHCFPQGVFVSNGPLGSAFPQTQGLALGDALAGRKRVTVTVVSDGASMEGEAKEAFAAIPGLAKAGKMAPYVMIISDNNTKLTGRIDKDSFSMVPTFESLKTLGWNVIALEKAHDLQACYEVLAKAIECARKNPTQPVAIHAKTIKGIGTKKTAESSSGGHGFPLKSPTELPAFLSEIYDGENYPTEFTAWIEELIKLEAHLKATAVKDTGEKIQKGVANALIRARKENLPVISVTSDLPGSTGVAEFRKEFPNDAVDVGVAESNMVSVAAGLSKVGYIPIVDTFAQFGVTKGALPFIMSSLSEAPVIGIFSHTGFQDAADGASHQSLSYMAMLASIPHVECYALTCSDEADALVYQAIRKTAEARRNGKVPPSYVFFLGRENFPKSYAPNLKYELGVGQMLFDNTAEFDRNVTLIGSGSMIPQTLKAAQELTKHEIGAIVINPSCLNHLDLALIEKALGKTENTFVTVEDHQIIGGLGQMICHALAEEGMVFKCHTLGVRGEFGQSAYTALDLYKKHGLDSEAIADQAIELFD